MTLAQADITESAPSPRTMARWLLAAGLAASTIVATAAPAQARTYRGHGGDGAAIAIGAGIVGLAIGAAIASDHGRRDDRYVEPGYRGPAYYPADRPNYYRDDWQTRAWREQHWREQEWRERAWREHAWREHEARDHGWHEHARWEHGGW